MSTLGVGIEVAGSELRVAIAERGHGQPKLVAVERHPLEVASAALRTRLGSRSHRALAAIPLARTTHRLLSLPFSDERTLAQVVPLELRGQLPSDPSDGRIGFEVIGRDPDGSRVLAVLVRQPDLDAVLAAATGVASLAGVTLGPLGLRWLLPPAFTGTVVLADGPCSTISVWRAGVPAALRALTARPDDPDAVAAELAWSLPLLGDPASPLVLAGPGATPALEQACRRSQLIPAALSLGHLELALPPEAALISPVPCGLALGALQHRAGVPFPITAASPTLLTPRVQRLAVAVVVLAALNLGLVRLELAQRDARLREALRAEAARVLPGEPIVAPRAQLEAAAARVRRSPASAAYGTALARLREVSERIPDGLVVDLTRLTLEGERLLLVGDAPTFESVDVLRRALVGSARLRDVATDEVRTTVDGKRVSFRLRARWVAHGEASS